MDCLPRPFTGGLQAFTYLFQSVVKVFARCMGQRLFLVDIDLRQFMILHHLGAWRNWGHRGIVRRDGWLSFFPAGRDEE